ncbi:hypothetical protein GCM10023083_38110 [Streptomyces phyllanthi]
MDRTHEQRTQQGVVPGHIRGAVAGDGVPQQFAEGLLFGELPFAGEQYDTTRAPIRPGPPCPRVLSPRGRARRRVQLPSAESRSLERCRNSSLTEDLPGDIL